MPEYLQDGGVFYEVEGEDMSIVAVYPKRLIKDHDYLGAQLAREWFEAEYPCYVPVE